MSESKAPSYKGANFALTREDALQRWRENKSTDPFKSIPFSLLSAGAILNYCRVTAMIFPFDAKNLKASSYRVGMGGMLIRWDGDKKIEQCIEPKGKIVLPPNSITFVQTDEEFLLPHYIAIRFNLKIEHVHRGLLLGTGPLVDPGFGGKLLIPLHNLTSSQYCIDNIDDLIWVEFTKTSFCSEPEESNYDSRQDNAHLFQERKNFLGPSQYLFQAANGQPIASSIPDSIKEASKKASDAAKDAKLAKNAAEEVRREFDRLKNVAIIGIVFAVLTVVLGALAVYAQAVSLVGDAVSSVSDLNNAQ